MKYVDYYAALGVSRDAGLPAIKQAYRTLAHQHHPDVSKAAGAEEKFKAVAVAYATLKNPEKRAAYDALGVHRDGVEMDPPASSAKGSEFDNSMPDFEGMAFADLLRAMRQGGHTAFRPSRAAQRGPDLHHTVQIELFQALQGCTLHVSMVEPPPGVTLEVKVPAGVRAGQQLRLAGKGGKGLHGGVDGDLYLTVSFAPHSIFQVEEQDLYFDLVLTPWEAALGAEVSVPTLDGEVLLTVPSGSGSGKKLRLRGRGLPARWRQGAGRGDLYARIGIAVPAHLSTEERSLLEQLSRVSTFAPRVPGLH